MKFGWVVVAWGGVAACAGSNGGPVGATDLHAAEVSADTGAPAGDTPTPDEVATDGVSDGTVPADGSGAVDGAGGPDGSDGADGVDAADTVDLGPAPPLLAERGLVAARTAIHVHSAFSHDACDGHGIEGGVMDAACVARLRAAVCATGFDFMLLTDHPAHMSDYPFVELLHEHPESGDALVLGDDGTPIANVLACPDGAGTRPAVLRVGFEGTHTMPVALQRHLDPAALEKVPLKDETPEEQRAAVVDAIHQAGGVALIAHSEEDELSAETIAALPLDGMEMYNFHANFNAVLSDAPERLFELEAFVDPAPGGPDPDLVGLVMLDVFPEPGMAKWRAVAAQRPIAGVVGHDVHENVDLSGYCDPGGEYESLCGLLEAAFPNLVATLKKGGPVIMEDGDRLDSYDRIFGWLHNRLLVTGVSPGAETEALLAGRNITVWNLFGEPEGLDVVAMTAAGPTEVGGRVSLADAPVLWVRLPAAPIPGAQNRWADLDVGGAELHAVLWRLLPDQAPVAAWETDEWGAVTALPLTDAGGYQLELWITPLHLAGAMAPLDEAAARPYRWAEANPIYVDP